MHGPSFPAAMPIMGTGIRVLQSAGFGAAVGMAYGALLDRPILTITVGDDRLVHEDDGSRDHSRMMNEFAAASADNPGVRLLSETFIVQLVDPATRERARRVNYGFVVDTVITGLEARLAAGEFTRS